MVVAVFPVVHAVFPPTAVGTPPFAGGVAVVQSPTCSPEGIGMAALAKDIVRSEPEGNHASEAHAAHNQRACAVVQRGRAGGGEVNAVAGKVAATHVPHVRGFG